MDITDWGLVIAMCASGVFVGLAAYWIARGVLLWLTPRPLFPHHRVPIYGPADMERMESPRRPNVRVLRGGRRS